jgi:hypothetical protein
VNQSASGTVRSYGTVGVAVILVAALLVYYLV